MRNSSAFRIATLLALAAAVIVMIGIGSAIVLARPRVQPEAASIPAIPPGAHLNPTAVSYHWPSQIHWRGRPGGPRMAALVGDQSKPGFYIVLMKFPPHMMSHPHFHKYDRYATVLSGTWWVGTGRKFDPAKMVPMPAGSFVIDRAGQVHYDGAKNQAVIIEIAGQGPVTMTPAESK